MNGHTPGPWRFELNETGKIIQLCGGNPKAVYGAYDLTVMDFTRWGMSGAAPRFVDQSGKFPVLSRADSFSAVSPGREHHANWFKLVRHPDAQMIEAAPDLYDALADAEAHLEEMRKDAKWHPIGHCPVLDKVRAALAKARGES